jgi:hypothetical protein
MDERDERRDAGGDFNKPADAMPRYRLLHAINALLLIALWTYALLMYAHLPEQIPQHIGPGGEVTRWGGKRIWFLLPILMSVHLVIVYGIGMSVSTAAGFNVPHKKRLLALPREAQQIALQPVRGFLFGMGTALMLLGWAVQYAIHYGARHGTGWPPLLPLIGAFLLLTILGAWRSSVLVRRRVAALEATLFDAPAEATP